MNIVITGGRGFVGTWLTKELTKQWPKATIISWDLPEVDITKPETFEDTLEELAPDWVVHLAAIASVPAALKNPELVEAVNVGGTENLLAAIQRLNLPTKVLFVSTADIYGETGWEYEGKLLPELPLSEAKPTNPYAKSKWEAERIIEEKYNDFVVRVRPFPHIGPGQATGFVTADFASQIAAIEKDVQEPVMSVGNLTAQRDFTDVRDVVRAYRLLMEKPIFGEVYHIASGQAVAIQQILDQLLKLSSIDITVTSDVDKMRSVDTPTLVGDTQKLRTHTNWTPKIPIDKSVEEILTWWREH